MMDRKSLKKLRKQYRKSSQSSGGSTSLPGSRGRRGGLGAFHFKQEKQCKQVLQLAKDGKSGELRVLLEGGLELEEIDHGIPALVSACSSGYLEVVAVLLRFGAHVNTCGDSECAPIHAAARKGHCGTIALLLSHGANVNLLNKSDKRTALHLAALMGHDEVIRLLLENHAEVDHTDIYGSTPLQLAARMGRQSTVEVLLRQNARVNAYDNDGWTSLHLAAESGNLTVLKILLKHNAQVDCQNKYGRTPLHWATSNGHSHIIQELLNQGANANIRDFHGKKPLQYATSLSIKSILQPLTNDDLEEVTTSSIGLYVHIDPRQSSISEEVEGKKAVSPISIISEGHGGSTSGVSSPGSSSTLSRNDLDLCDSVAGQSPILLQRVSEDSDTESAPKLRVPDADKVSSVSSSPRVPPRSNVLLASTPRENTPVRSECSSISTFSRTLNIGLSEDDSDNLENLPKNEIIKHRKLMAHTFDKLMAGLSGIKSDIQTISRDLGRSRDSLHIDVLSASLKSTQERLQRLQTNLTDIQEEFTGDYRSIKISGKNLVHQVEGGYSRDRLPNAFYQATLYSAAKHVSHVDNGWQRVICSLELHKGETSDRWVQVVRNESDNTLECALRAVFYASTCIAKKESSALKDLLHFLEACDLEKDIKPKVIADILELLQHDKEEKVVVGAPVFYNLSTKMGDQGKELGLRLGVPRDQITAMEEELEDSTQALCLGIMSLWNATDERKDKLNFLVECLIDIGREDLLAAVLLRHS